MPIGNNEAKKLADQLKKLDSELDKFVTTMGVEAKNHFQQSFRDGGFTDRNLETWQPRKNLDAGRATLVKTGDLRRSIKVVKVDRENLKITSDLDYAAIHNYGGEGLAWGKHVYQMPKRQFIGDSYKLTQKLLRILKTTIAKIFQ